MREDNLIIPGLIGENEQFTNLKEYITHENQSVAKQISDLEQKTVMMLQKDITKSNNLVNEELSKMRQYLMGELINFKERQNTYIETEIK